MTPRILALGSANVDLQLRADRWPEPGETLLGRDFFMAGGGKSSNVAWLARHLGVEAQLIAQCGDDALRDIALDSLRTIGVDLSTVLTQGEHPTGVSMILVPDDGRKGIILAANANDVWTEEYEQMAGDAVAQAPDGSILCVNLEVPVAVVKRALREAQARGIRSVLDPSPAERVDKELLASSAYVTPNQSEARRLTELPVDNAEQAMKAAEKLHRMANIGICLKLGDGGCAVVTCDQRFLVTTPPVKPVDTTGAGDAFAGALSVALLEDQPLPQAVSFAVAASSYAVTGYGSQSSYPNREDIRTRLRHITVTDQ